MLFSKGGAHKNPLRGARESLCHIISSRLQLSLHLKPIYDKKIIH